MQQIHAVFGELAHYGSEPFKSDTNVNPLSKNLGYGPVVICDNSQQHK